MRVAAFNLHAGIDGWGRPYDVVEACRNLAADVVVLEEVWATEGEESLAAQVAKALGYEGLAEHWTASGRRLAAEPCAPATWGPMTGTQAARNALFLGPRRPKSDAASARLARAVPGRFGLAVLTRHPLRRHQVVELGQLPRDPVRRAALVVEADTEAGPLAVAGVHMAHLTKGSPLHFARLRRAVGGARETEAVVAGDMNLWGPPLVVALAGWRRAVRGPTWPAWRPHSQLDHLLVSPSLEVVAGEVLGFSGSDHRPVVAELAARPT